MIESQKDTDVWWVLELHPSTMDHHDQRSFDDKQKIIGLSDFSKTPETLEICGATCTVYHAVKIEVSY